MPFIRSAFRALGDAIIDGDPPWHAVTFFLASIVIGIVVAGVRASRNQ